MASRAEMTALITLAGKIDPSLASTLSGASKQLSGLQKNTSNIADKFDKVGSKLTSAGKKLTKSVTAPILAAAAAGVVQFASFDDAVRQVMATMGDTDSYDKLSAAAKEAGASTKFTASESAEALNNLALAGYNVDKAISTLPKVLDLTAAGGMDLAYTSDLLTDSMAALGLSTDELDVFMDQMARTSQKSNTNISQLGEAILTVGGTAKKLKGGTKELNTALGVLANRGIKGAEGGTHLRNMIVSLGKTSGKGAKQLKKLGVSAYDKGGNLRGLDEIMTDLNTKMEGMSDKKKAAIMESIFNKTDLAAAEALLAGVGDEWEYLSEQIEKSEGATAQMAKIMESGLGGALRELASAGEGLVLEFIEPFTRMLEPALKSVTEKMREFAGWFKKLGKEKQDGITKMVIAIAAIGPALLIFGKAATGISKIIKGFKALKGAFSAFSAIGGLASPLGQIMLILTALAAIGIFVWKNWEKIAPMFENIWNSITSAFSNVAGWFKSKFGGAWNAVKSAFANAGGWAKEKWDQITTAFGNVKKWFTDKFSGIADEIGTAFGTASTWASEKWNEITAAFNDGSVAGWFTEKFTGVSDAIGAAFGTASTWATEKWGEITTAFNNGNVHGWFLQEFTGLGSTILTAAGDISKWASDGWAKISTAFGEGGNVHAWATSTFGDVGGTISVAVGDAAGWASAAWSSISDVFSGASEKITSWFSGIDLRSATTGVSSWASGKWNEITNAFNTGNIKGWFTQEFSGLGSTILTAAGDVSKWASDGWAKISTAFGEGGDVHAWATSKFGDIGSTISLAVGDVAGWASTAWGEISTAFGDPVAYFTTMFEGVPGAIETVLSSINTWVTGTFGSAWNSAWGTVVGYFGTQFSKLGDLVKAPINAVIDVVNGAISKINGISVSIPDWVPGMGGQTFGMSIPSISKLALGDTLSSPTLALLAEKPGLTETVVPHTNTPRSQSLAREALAGTGQSLGGGAAPVFNITINVTGDAKAAYEALIEAAKAAIDEYFRQKERVSYGY